MALLAAHDVDQTCHDAIESDSKIFCHQHYILNVKKGQILFELDGASKRLARQAIYKATRKLPIMAKFVELSYNHEKKVLLLR